MKYGSIVTFGAILSSQLLVMCYARKSHNYVSQSGVKDYPPPLPPTKMPKNAIQIPLFRQATYYTCGVASLDACLHYWQVYDDIEASLAEECGTSEEEGTPPENIVKVAQSYNLTAYMTEGTTVNDLEVALSKGYTVILDVQAWSDLPYPVDWKNDWEDGHYVVLMAIDKDYVYIMDPSTGATYAYIPMSEFEDRWHDYENLADGTRRDYHHTAIFIHGKNKLPSPPDIYYMA